jgi:transcriptional regulator GlxA family with amidase domain
VLFGTTTTFLEFDPMEYELMFGIRFKPAGMTAFTHIPLIKFTDQSEELALLETLFDKSYYDVLTEKRSAAELIAHTNSYLISRLPNLYLTDRQIVHAVNAIDLTKGRLNLADLASEVCLGQRHFERKFKAMIGVTPKMFAKVTRFQHAWEKMLACPNKDVLTIAVESGYYDHTHLINDFKSLTGETPADLRKKSIFYANGDVFGH